VVQQEDIYNPLRCLRDDEVVPPKAQELGTLPTEAAAEAWIAPFGDRRLSAETDHRSNGFIAIAVTPPTRPGWPTNVCVSWFRRRENTHRMTTLEVDAVRRDIWDRRPPCAMRMRGSTSTGSVLLRWRHHVAWLAIQHRCLRHERRTALATCRSRQPEDIAAGPPSIYLHQQLRHRRSTARDTSTEDDIIGRPRPARYVR